MGRRVRSSSPVLKVALVLVVMALVAVLPAKEFPVLAQEQPVHGSNPETYPAGSGVKAADGEDFAVGEPGLSYRQTKQLGVDGVPYFEDTSHLNNPQGVATDGNNVWIVESWGLRALAYDGNSGAFVQQIGQAGYRRGIEGADLEVLSDVAVDSHGNIWLADGGASHVVSVDTTGNLLSELGVAWNQGADNDHFYAPLSVAFDSAGNVYVSDGDMWGSGGNHRVQIFDSGGNYLNTIGQSAVAGSDNVHFNQVKNIAIDVQDRLYIADAGNHRVQIFDVSDPAAPAYVATLGQTGNAGNGNNQLSYPRGVAVDANSIFVADTGNSRIQVFQRTTRTYVATIDGNSSDPAAQFRYPTDVAAGGGTIYVADPSLSLVQQYNSSRAYVRSYGVPGVPYVTDQRHFNVPGGVAVAEDGSMYIVETRGHRLVKLDSAGNPAWAVGEAGIAGTDANHFFGPMDVAIAPSGQVYVVNGWNNGPAIKVYDGSGNHVTSFGDSVGLGNDQFNSPQGVAVAANGNVYVADTNNHRVQVFDGGLNYVATLGQSGVAGADNAHFNAPMDVAVDDAGNIYVVDQANHRVQVFGSNRSYVRTMGETGVQGWDHFHFSWPIGVAVDSRGRTYVGDNWGSIIKVYNGAGAYLTTIPQQGRISRNYRGLAVVNSGFLYAPDIIGHVVNGFAPGFPGWVQRNINGFGDISNSNINTLSAFQGNLYAGTYTGGQQGGQLWRLDEDGNWNNVAKAGFGVDENIGYNDLLSFQDKLYLGIRNDADGGAIYRSSDGDAWSPVMTGGFGDAQTKGVYRFQVFGDQLYAGTGIFTTTHGSEIWRSPSGDGGTWERVVENGFDSANNFIMRTSAVHDGKLYFATQNIDTSDYMTTTGAVVIRSESGDSGNWTKVADNGFGNINNYTVSGLVSFDGYLYAATSSWDWRGSEVWRCTTCDGQQDWEKVVDNGFGDRNSWGLSALHVFDGRIYLVLGNHSEGLQVWRSDSGDANSWSVLAMGGFGDVNNGDSYYNSGAEFDGKLYIGMSNGANGAELWMQLADQTYLPSMMR